MDREAAERRIVELLGTEASAVGWRPLAQPGPAGDTVAWLVFRGVEVAAAGQGPEGSGLALLQKLEAHAARLRELPEISTVAELNISRYTASGTATRVPVRPMSRERALFELDLGVEGALLFHEESTRTFGLVWRGIDGEPTMLGIGEPILGDDAVAQPRPVPGKTPTSEEAEALRAGKAERLRPLLRCPLCRGELADRPGELYCAPCARAYPYVRGKPVLATGEGYDATPEEQPESNNPYGSQVLELIETYRDGLVLDMGSGNPTRGFYNVIHLDLFAFDQVDVVTDGQGLPFGDDVFDAILSEAVLEHVEDPIAYTRELARVLKPGGRVRLDAAFLQPYHGYPDHYFNMTRSGLRKVVEESGLRVLDLEAGPHQQPLVTLGLVAGGLLRGTADEERKRRLGELTLAQAVDLAMAGDGRLLEGLSREAIDRLAAGFACLAEKPR